MGADRVAKNLTGQRNELMYTEATLSSLAIQKQQQLLSAGPQYGAQACPARPAARESADSRSARDEKPLKTIVNSASFAPGRISEVLVFKARFSRRRAKRAEFSTAVWDPRWSCKMELEVNSNPHRKLRSHGLARTCTDEVQNSQFVGRPITMKVGVFQAQRLELTLCETRLFAFRG